MLTRRYTIGGFAPRSAPRAIKLCARIAHSPILGDGFPVDVQRPHSALDDRTPAAFANLHRASGARFALTTVDKASGNPRQGFASPAGAALDPGTTCLKMAMVRAKRSCESSIPETHC